MYKIILWGLTTLSFVVFGFSRKAKIGIGAVFEAEEYDKYNQVFQKAFVENHLLAKSNASLIAQAAPLPKDLYSSFLSLCNLTEEFDLKALLVVGRLRTIQTVSQVAQPLGIPVLGYTTDIVVDKFVQIHNPLFLMLKPSRVDQAQAFLQFFQANFWFNIILIVQDTFNVDGFSQQFSVNSSDPKWNIRTEIISEHISTRDIIVLATSLLGTNPKIVVIHANIVLSTRIFSVLNAVNITQQNHAWFLTETSYTRDHDGLQNFPAGTLSVVPNYAVHIDDVIVDGVNLMIKAVMKFPPRYNVKRKCLDYPLEQSDPFSNYMYKRLIRTELTGLAGDIIFDQQGQLKSYSFVVQNLVQEESQRFWRQIGHIRGDDVSPFGIIWPGESITSNVKYGRKKYRIVTNPVKPFVMDNEPHPDYGNCAKDTTCVYINNTGKLATIQALQDYEDGVYNKSNPYKIMCCRGLSVDLLNRLASDLDFDYNLYIVSDRTYGKQDANGSWNGLMRDLMSGTAHMAIAAFSITIRRVKAIDFTNPYFFSGFSVLYREKQRATNMRAFLEPFDVPVWFGIIIGATLTAIAMGIFEWNSPFGLNPWGKKRKQNYTLASGMTMVYSVLFGHTVKTKSPKAWPSKVMQNFWAFACIFIIASYTANLAAFIAGKHAGITYSSVHDSRLLDISVGVLGGSAVEGIVKKLNPRLYTMCQQHLVDTTDKAINSLIHGNLDAYLGDYPILDYARAKLDPDCALRLLTQPFGEDGYGVGLPKGSPLKTPLSQKIQDYHESGYIEDLTDVHFADSQCYKQRITQEDSQLEVLHHAGSFVMVCVGIICGVFVMLLEHAVFKWLIPMFRDMPGNSIWKSVHVMFFSQRLHRTINSAELVPAHETYREMIGIMKNREFLRLFQKSTIRTNKMADAAKRKRLNRNFFDIVEKAKCDTGDSPKRAVPKMKEMQDNNLFGDDSSPNTPTAEITEISLKDITQVVDLDELKKQNKENLMNFGDIFVSLKESNVDEAENQPHSADNKLSFDWTSQEPEQEVNSAPVISIVSPPSENAVPVDKRKPSESRICSLNIDPIECDPFPYASSVYNSNNTTLNTISETDDLLNHDCELLGNHRPRSNHVNHSNTPRVIPNGDLFSASNRQIPHFGCYSDFEAYEYQNKPFTSSSPLTRHGSMPATKMQKDSRTYHPRKHQTLIGMKKESTKRQDPRSSTFNIDKYTKEELLLMWKSSEVELSDKLEAAIKDKEKLQSKLAGLKGRYSTSV